MKLLRKKAEEANNTVQEKELIREIEDKLDTFDNLPDEMQSYINLAYYAGKQWISYDTVNRKLFEPPKNPSEIRYVGNRIKKIVRTELAKVFKNQAVPQVIPASNNDDDIDSAVIGEKICEWLEYELDLGQKDRDLVLWGLTTRICIIEPYWNTSKGDNISYEGESPEDDYSGKTGDVDIDIINLFECKYDPTAKQWEDVQWFCKEKVRTVDYVKEVYGVEVKPEDDIVETNCLESQLRNLSTTWNTTTAKQTKNSVKVKEYWEKPSTKHPKGRRVTIANGELLAYVDDIGFGDQDDTERELPFFPFVHIVIPGRVPGQSIIEDLIPVQREYNRVRSKIIEYNKKMSGKWVIEEDSLVDDITDADDQILEYHKHCNPPKIEQPGNLGADVYKNLEQLLEEFYFISGQQEVSHGSTPTGVTSGVAIQFLQEQDDTVMGPTIRNYVRCKQKYMSYMLKMIRYMYREERTLKIVGKNKEIETVSFYGNEITSTDVRISEGSMLHASKAGKQQWIMNLIQAGLFNPQQDRDIILKMLELGIDDELYDNTEIDRNQAQNEQTKWMQGDFSPDVRDFYNHTIHILEHNKFRKGSDYEELKAVTIGNDALGNPITAQQLVDLHVQQHQEFINQMQQQQLLEQVQQAITP